MEIGILEGIGLTKGEAKVYLALFELGPSTTGPIAKKAKISPSKVYPILDRLIEKSLVGFIIKGKIKYFEAASPQKLLGFLKNKKRYIEEQEKIVNSILSKFPTPKNTETRAFLYNGIESIKNMYDEIYSILKKGDEYIAYGISGSPSLRGANAFFQDWQIKRGKKGIKGKIVYEYNAMDIAKKRTKAPLTEVKILPKTFKTPAGINIYGNKTAIILWVDNPLLIIIESSEIAQSFREYFKIIWTLAKSV